MNGRKMEEGDWQEIYCLAKGIPNRGWSNLNIDVVHDCVGVEQKMLQPTSVSLLDLCGKRLMHPAATRSIRIPGTADPNEAMRDLLNQYGEIMARWRRFVQEQSSCEEPDMRFDWLLWDRSLTEFLYFEEEMLAPNPDNYRAEWRESGGGTRKTSKNLWIYEKETSIKRYSITTVAGAKIQPYFDIPARDDPNLYFFRIQGEEIGDAGVRLWLSNSTLERLSAAVGDLTPENLALFIADAADGLEPGLTGTLASGPPSVTSIIVPRESYAVLTNSFPSNTDEGRILELIARLRF